MGYVVLGLLLLLVGVVQERSGRAVRVGIFLGVTTFCYWTSHLVWWMASTEPVYRLDDPAAPNFINMAFLWLAIFALALPYEIYGVVTSVRKALHRPRAALAILLGLQLTTIGYVGLQVVDNFWTALE